MKRKLSELLGDVIELKWWACDCGYDKCKAKVRIGTYERYVCIGFVTWDGKVGEALFTVETAKLLLKDFENAIKKLEGK